jgi:hypothetical protein
VVAVGDALEGVEVLGDARGVDRARSVPGRRPRLHRRVTPVGRGRTAAPASGGGGKRERGRQRRAPHTERRLRGFF